MEKPGCKNWSNFTGMGYSTKFILHWLRSCDKRISSVEKLLLFYFCLLYFIAFRRNSQRMPADFTEALLEIFMKEGKMDKSSAEEFLKSLESTRHFQSKTWS